MTINNLPPKYFPPTETPKYRFGDTLETQEKELATSPLLARMRESRTTLSSDPHRPTYHFVSPESNHNDANGLCNWGGNWHLFYQGNPPDGDGRVHWGHAVSADLIHWRDLPYAIHPSPERHCFSGSTLVEEDRVIAMYYGVEQGLMVATSSDPLLLNW
ncbi:MAG: glycosyl hydrolase family 32 domain protein, partial [Candidatus Poribacteria bacterium]|nr:glycosyl hydrolase family 32 domain protein [Candidatus Poribacteria bacterium]